MTEAFPLRYAPEEAFPAVREYLSRTGYTEEFVLGHFGLPSLHFLLFSYGKLAEALREKFQGDGTPLFLTRLLLGGFPATQAELSAHMPEATQRAFLDLGILEKTGDGGYQAPVLLYPGYGLYLAADRGMRPDGTGYRGKDYVMSGAENLCRQFVNGFAKTPCRTLADIGTGAGLAALVASSFAEQVYAVDITERAIRYAEFNRVLNNASNITFKQGDLFAPFAGLKFDRIVSNPPFEPPLKQGWIFSVGGSDGEGIVERLITEAPNYLEPGGRLYCQMMGTDRAGETYEQRVHRWVGSRCDAAVFVRTAMKPEDYAVQQVLGENQDSWKVYEWQDFYQRLQVQQVLLGYVVVQKPDRERPVFLTRREFGPHSGLPQMEWLLDWETRCTQPETAETLLASKPRVVSGWELRVTHAMMNGQLNPTSYSFVVTHPFQLTLPGHAWVAMLASRCDGKSTGADHMGWLQSKMELSREEFLSVLATLVSAGIVAVEGFEAPAPPAAAATV